jgi:hypothetical protein
MMLSAIFLPAVFFAVEADGKVVEGHFGRHRLDRIGARHMRTIHRFF